MTTRSRKPLGEYFATVLDRIQFKVRCNERTGHIFIFALVPSEFSSDSYMVGLDDHDNAIWCECGDHSYRQAVCKHMQAVDLKKRIAAVEAQAAANDKTYKQAVADSEKISVAYDQLGADIVARGNLSSAVARNRAMAAPTTVQSSSTVAVLAARGLMR